MKEILPYNTSLIHVWFSVYKVVTRCDEEVQIEIDRLLRPNRERFLKRYLDLRGQATMSFVSAYDEIPENVPEEVVNEIEDARVFWKVA